MGGGGAKSPYISGAILLFSFLFWLAPELRAEPFGAQRLPGVNSEQHDYWPQISPEGRFLVFQSNRPGYLGSYNLWVSINLDYSSQSEDGKKKLRWTSPVPLTFPLTSLLRKLGEREEAESDLNSNFFLETSTPRAKPFSVNSEHFEGSPALLYRGGEVQEIFFTFAKTEGSPADRMNDLDIYYAGKKNGVWEKPRPLLAVNSEFQDRMPSLSRDGRYLVFSSNRPGSLGKHDLWFSEREPDFPGAGWSLPRNAGPKINSSYNETSPNLGSYGKRLFFSSDRPGGLGRYDIYTSHRIRMDGKWQKSKNIGSPYNSARDDEGFSVSSDGLWAYFASDRRKSGPEGGFDIYRAPLPLELYTSRSIIFTGQVIDGSSKETLGVDATIKIFRLKTREQLKLGTSFAFRKAEDARNKNNFKLSLGSGYRYRAEISAPGFLPQSLLLDYRRGNFSSGLDRRIIPLQRWSLRESGLAGSLKDTPCPELRPSCLDTIKIYFASDLSEISERAKRKLETVAEILKKNPELRIHIEGHADSTNTQSYNQRLSEDRAEAARRLLLRAGIEANRLRVRGHSFLRPAVPEKSIKDRSLNRRVEFTRL